MNSTDSPVETPSSGECLLVTRNLKIPLSELDFAFTRSSGPGGQNVNKVNTRVTVRFNVLQSTSLTESQRQRIQEKLSRRISKDGILQVNSEHERSQSSNRRTALAQLVALLQVALKRKPPRYKTRVPQHAHERRIDGKKRRGQLKKARVKKISWND